MADTYSDSLLTNAQVELSTKYNEAELRRKERSVLTMTMRNAEYTLPDYQALKTSENRTVEVKYLEKKAAGSATAKVAEHTGAKSSSGTLNLSWSCLTETFYTSRKMAQNNVIGFEKMFQHQLEQAIDNLKDRAETAGLAYAVANNCQLASPTTQGGGSWVAANNALEVTEADKFVHRTKAFMRGRYYRGMYDMITDNNLYAELEPTMWQGAGNSTNLNPQFAGVNFGVTTEAISNTYDKAALIMPEGSMKALVWNDPLNVSGINSGDNNVGFLTTLADPMGSGMVFDVSKYTKRGDESSNGGGVQDILDQWEVAVWIGWGIPPLSTSDDSVIHLAALIG